MIARAGNDRVPAAAAGSPSHGDRLATVALAAAGLLMAEVLGRVLRDSGLHVVGCFATLEALLEKLRRCRPAIALVDAELCGAAGGSGELLAELRGAGPATKLVVVAAAVDGSLARAAMEHDASAVILKSSPLIDAIEVIRQVIRGQTSFPAAVLARLGDRDDSGRLSARQLEVLEQLALGRSNEEIARRLFISVNTVKFHLRVISQPPRRSRRPPIRPSVPTTRGRHGGRDGLRTLKGGALEVQDPVGGRIRQHRCAGIRQPSAGASRR